MRTIKFRAKIKAESLEQKLAMLDKPNSEGEWAYGEIHLQSKIPHIHSEFFKYPIDVETIGQFTGVRDYNGNEVYEGDIITIVRRGKNISPSLVEWLDCGFIRRGIKNYNSHNMYYLSRADAEYFKVVGNIYDNPDLLNNTKEK